MAQFARRVRTRANLNGQLPLPFVLAPHARFETFVAGPNAAVVAHLRSSGAGEGFETLWIWGPEGSGKSHLLQAACAAQSERRAIFLPLGQLEKADTAVFEGLEALDLVALDDVDRIASSIDWNRALFNLFNDIENEGGCLVMSANGPPAAMAFGLADLRSRAGAASVYQLHALGDDERLSALKLHAAARGLELTDPAARYLLTRVRRDMAGLYDRLDALDRASLAAQRKLTIPLIRETLAGRP